ncbi:MAG: FG-GAP repeat protein [Alphaproteobacteria bacterium]|nr:FG-GAP repeat protein [Alphaproteobacteria bacterium]
MVPPSPVIGRAPALLLALLLPACTIITDDAYEWRVSQGGDAGDDGGEDSGCTPSTWFADADGDGLGDPDQTTEACDAPTGTVANGDDCDDGDAAIGAGIEFFGDADGDGYGVASVTQTACTAPTGFVATAGDCDDDDGDVNPGATESCATEADDDCDGQTNAQDADACTVFYLDADGDGYGDGDATECWCEPTGDYRGDQPGDCADDSFGVNPGAEEICFDGIDNDCDGRGCQLTGLWTEADADGSYSGAGGSEAGDRLAMLPDTDGDGRAELAVGASRYQDSGARPGAVHVLAGDSLGEDSLEAVDIGLFVGIDGGDRAGRGLSGLPDQDGDGLAELVVGAPSADAGATDGGVVYIVSGPATGDASLDAADAILWTATTYEYAGRAVVGVPDATGDGVPDLLVGAPGNDLGGNSAGAALLLAGPFSGTVDLTTLQVATLFGQSANDGAGRQVGSAGDVDGDGLTDLLVGAHQNDGGGSNAGAAYLVLGGVEGELELSDADLVLLGAAAGDVVGRALAGGADADGDGVDDLLIGAEGADGGAGAVYLVSGDERGLRSLSDVGLRLSGEAAGDAAGTDLAFVGDLDRDGRSELIVGAPGSDRRVEDGGAVYLVYGGLGGALALSDADLVIEGADGGLGSSVAAGLDLDGDGIPDFAAGAVTASDGDGAVRLFLGGGL